jgi:16S rRNA (guanine527-N7)-methyltransferase
VVDPLIEFTSVCRANGLLVSAEQGALLRRYHDLLIGWNSNVNLISRRDEGNIWTGHFLHSISPLFLLRIPENLKVLDLGTGGGLPGIPLAIFRSDFRVTLLDSIQKKTAALNDIVARLSMVNVAVRTGRGEDLCRTSGFAHEFDLVTARAVAPLADILRWSFPFLKGRPQNREVAGSKPGAEGCLDVPGVLVYKGGDLTGEIAVATIKAKPGRVDVVDLVFAGSAGLGFEGKKLIAAYPK